MKIALTFALSLVLHLTLGWAWTLGAGFAGGFWAARRGWLVGLLGVGLGWAALVGYNAVVAGPTVRRMATAVGGLLGNLPGFAVVIATVLIGALLGALGGAAGTQLAVLSGAARRRRPEAG